MEPMWNRTGHCFHYISATGTSWKLPYAQKPSVRNPRSMSFPILPLHRFQRHQFHMTKRIQAFWLMKPFGYLDLYHGSTQCHFARRLCKYKRRKETLFLGLAPDNLSQTAYVLIPCIFLTSSVLL